MVQDGIIAELELFLVSDDISAFTHHFLGKALNVQHAIGTVHFLNSCIDWNEGTSSTYAIARKGGKIVGIKILYN